MSLKSTKLSVHLRKKNIRSFIDAKKCRLNITIDMRLRCESVISNPRKLKKGFSLKTKTFTFAITLNFMTREFEWSGLQIKIDHFNAVLPLQSKNTLFYDFELKICKCARISYDKKVFIEVRTVLTVVCFVYSIHVEYCYGCSV